MKNLIFLFAFLLVSTLGFSQWEQVGQTLVESEDIDERYVVSMSNDGTIIAIGSPLNDGGGTNAGRTQVFSLVNGVWVEMGLPIYGELPNDRSGESISLSSDGSIIAIGARFNSQNGPSFGHARVYKFNQTDWVQLGNDIDGSISGDAFGRKVILSEDGSRIAIGIPFNDDVAQAGGKIKIYDYENGSWSQLGQDINGTFENDNIGFDFSLSNNGDFISAGTSANENNYVKTFRFIDNDWIQWGQTIEADTNGNRFGENTAINNTGELLLVGIKGSDIAGEDHGQVRLYKLIGNEWQPFGEDLFGENNFENFGVKSSFSEDSNVFAISSYKSVQGEGKLYFYKIIDGGWENLGSEISGMAQGEFLAEDFQLSSLGNIFVASSYNGSTQPSNVKVFTNNTLLSTYEPVATQFKLYPNPNQGIFDITFTENKPRVTVKITDLLGRQVVTIEYFDTNKVEVNENLKTGIYLVEISAGGISETVRIVVD